MFEPEQAAFREALGLCGTRPMLLQHELPTLSVASLPQTTSCPLEGGQQMIGTDAGQFGVTHASNNDTTETLDRNNSGEASMRSLRDVARALACLACLSPLLAADIIHYKDGRKLEGTIVERTATEVKVDTSFGTITVAMSKISRIEEKLTPVQELAQQRAKLKDDDAPALFQLALWAEEHDLRRESKALLREVVAADPKHRRAQEKLGRVEVDGVWLEPDEVDAYLERVAAEKMAQGLLFHEGEWLPEADVMKAQGFVLYHGDWVPRREAETSLALEDLVSMAGYETQAVAGEFVTLFSSTLDEETVEFIIYDLDALVRDFLKRLQLNELELARVTKYDVPIFVVPDNETSDRMVQSGFTKRFIHSDAAGESFIGRNSYGLQWPRPVLVLVEGNYLEAQGDRKETRMGILTHQLAELLVERVKGQRDAPGWAKAGLAALYEGVTNYYATVTITSNSTIAEDVPTSLWVPGWENFPAWRDNLRDEQMQLSVSSLKGYFARRAESFDSRDVGVCWSFVDFLMDRHRTEFCEYLRLYDTETDADRSIRRMHERAWPRAFASSPDEVEREWRGWAAARPERFPKDMLDR